VWREAKLVYRGGDMCLCIAVEVPKRAPVEPMGVIAVDNVVAMLNIEKRACDVLDNSSFPR